MTRPANLDPSGPLVVTGDRWGLPGGLRGGLEGRTVAHQAALVGVETALVLAPTPPEAVLWTAACDEVEAIGTDDTGGAGPWRYRVTVPGGRPVTLVLVERDAGHWGGPWAGLAGGQLCTALRVLELHLGVSWSHSTSRTAETLILATHPRQRGGRRMERAAAVPGPAAAGTLEQPWQAWQRELTEIEAAAPYVHTFDANAAFLGCWQTVTLGFGKTEHLTTPGACESAANRPGVWRVELPAGWSDGEGLPPIAPQLRRDDAGQLAGWVMGPTLGRLRQWAQATGQGEVVPVEGHAWPEGSRYLRSAGERLRDARQAALEARELLSVDLDRVTLGDLPETELETILGKLVAADAVREAVRDLYTITTGRFATNRAHAAGMWRRPDWTNTIRAEWRANLHRKLATWAQTGARPFAIATDAVAFATTEPDPEAFAAWVGIRLGDALGAWKHQGTAPLSAVLPHLGGRRRAVGAVFATAASSRP